MEALDNDLWDELWAPEPQPEPGEWDDFPWEPSMFLDEQHETTYP